MFIIENETIRNIAGFILVAWGYFDALKYHILGTKIKQLQSAKGQSRRFINFAIGNDLYRLFYFFFVDRNYYLLISSLVALYCMCYMFWEIYLWYPYRRRGLLGFKRPNIVLYLINSLQTNSLRKRL